MNVGNYTYKLSEWMQYKKYSPESIKNYVSCLGKFLEYFKNQATKPSEISAEKIKLFLTDIKEPKAILCKCGQPTRQIRPSASLRWLRKSIESMLHHNSVQKAEIERLRKALTDITALDVSTNKNSFEDDFAMCVSIASNTLTKKEGNNG